MTILGFRVINPLRVCAAGVTVLGLCVCVCVRMCVSLSDYYARTKSATETIDISHRLMSDISSFSSTNA